MHFNQAKPSNNQNTNEDRSETTITLAGSGLPRHYQKCKYSRLEAIDPAQEGMCNYVRFASVPTLYYSSDMLNNNVLIYDFWHELLKTLWLV